jgi:hypothetical protein
MVERGEGPHYRANALIHGDIAAATLANVVRAYKRWQSRADRGGSAEALTT